MLVWPAAKAGKLPANGDLGDLVLWVGEGLDLRGGLEDDLAEVVAAP
jgi:hypothetical protein